MDNVQDWAAYVMGDHAEVLPYARQALGIVYTLKSYLLPLVDAVSQKPDLATIALVVVILFVSLKILNMLWQTVVFWLRLAWRLLFWGGLVGLALWMYTRGPDGVQEDLQYWLDTWNGEYKYWKDQDRIAKVLRQKPATPAYTRPAAWY